jgi:hypothetical protein
MVWVVLAVVYLNPSSDAGEPQYGTAIIVTFIFFITACPALALAVTGRSAKLALALATAYPLLMLVFFALPIAPV